MSRYRNNLPQTGSDIFLTDGGLETCLVFQDGLELPEFAAFDLLKTKEGAQRIDRYLDKYTQIAIDHGTGFILQTPTWRASPDWGQKLGYSRDEIAAVNRLAIENLEVKRSELSPSIEHIVISGCIGPQGDGYDASNAPSIEIARAYHAFQIGVFKDTAADIVSAMTITTSDEAAGIVLAARDADMPVVIGFTVETDGTLPNGEALAEAIARVDAASDEYAAYFIINCAHPTHFANTFKQGEGWMERIRGLRANASACSHEELDNAEELDEGDPQDLGARYAALRKTFPQLTVLGGCCGTDHRHIKAIAEACCQ